MSTWANVRDELKAAFLTQVSTPGASPTVGVAWTDEPRPHAAQLLLLSVVSWSVLHDRVVLTRAGGNLQKSISSLVQATIQVQAESEEVGGGDHSLLVSERARLGMQLGQFAGALSSVELVGEDQVTSGLRSNYEADGRQISATIFEFQIRFESTLSDPTIYYPMTAARVCGDVEEPAGNLVQVICENIPGEDGMALNDLHFSKMLTLNGAGVSMAANVDGSSTAQYMELRPPDGEIWYVARILEHIKCSGVAAWNEFGDIAALTNGIKFEVVRGTGAGATVTQSLTDDLHPIRENDDFAMYQFDVSIVENGAGPSTDSVFGRLTFARFGAGLEGGIFLNGSTEDALRMTVRDNLTTLSDFHVLAQGQIYNTQQVPL